MMKSIYVKLIIIFIVNLTVTLFMNSSEKQVMYNANTYIGIGIHGYPATGFENPGNFERAGAGYNNLPGCLYEGTFVIPDYARNNVFAYKMSQSRHDNNLTYINEIGNFNNGSTRLNNIDPDGNYNTNIKMDNPQCFISLAKLDWIYRKFFYESEYADMIPDEDKEIIIMVLLRNDIRFYDLYVSKAYLSDKINNLKPIINYDEEGNIPTYKIDDENGEKIDVPQQWDISGSVKELLSDNLFDVVQRYDVPNTLKIFTHSMGGMFTLRYLTAPESERLYEFYRDYTFSKFKSDIRDENLDYYPVYRKLIDNLKENNPEISTDDDAENFLYPIFREERENIVDTALIQDGPLAGSETSKFAINNYNDIKSTFTDNYELQSWIASMTAACIANIVLASIEMIVGGILMCNPFTYLIGQILFYHGFLCITIDTILLLAVIFLEFDHLSGGLIAKKIIDDNDDASFFDMMLGFGVGMFEGDFVKGFDPERVKLLKDLPHDSDFISRYRDKDPPKYTGNTGIEEEIQIHNLTVSGVESIKNEGRSVTDIPFLILTGLIQGRILLSLAFNLISNAELADSGLTRELYLGLHSAAYGIGLLTHRSLALFKLIIDIVMICVSILKANSDDVSNSGVLLEVLTPVFFDVLGIKHEPGAILFCHSESTGLDKKYKVNPIANNGNAYVYHISTTSKYQKLVQDILGNTNPSRSRLKDEFMFSYYRCHQWSQNALFMPVSAIKNKLKKDSHKCGDGYIYFNNYLFDKKLKKEMDDPDYHKEDNPYSDISQMTRTFSTLKTSKLDGPLVIPDWDYKETDNLTEDDTRDLYHLFTFGYNNWRSPNNVYVIDHRSLENSKDETTDIYGNNIEYYDDVSIQYDKGFNSILYREVESNIGNKKIKLDALNYLEVTNYVYVIPLNIYNYYEGMNFEYSINGSDYKKITYFDEELNNTAIEEYGESFIDTEMADAEFFYCNDGRGILISPHFKEGYNEVLFKFIDPAGRIFYKSVVVLQITAPPFIKPDYPKMNEYVDKKSFTLSVNCLHIGDGTTIPDEWFMNADYSITLDGQLIGTNITKDEENRKIYAELYGLDEGNHEIEFTVTYGGITNSQYWRFWVDTEAPEIIFEDKYVFSNKDKNNQNGLSYYIKDTVPYKYGIMEGFDVDTILLSDLEVALSRNGAVVDNIYNKNPARLGAYAHSWNGWNGDTQLDEGFYELSIKAADRVNNESLSTAEVIIDNTAPEFYSIDLNTDLINLESGLFELNYSCDLQDWEEYAVMEIEVYNVNEKQSFNRTEYILNEDESVFTLAYYSHGVNVFKDGEYDITVTLTDPLGNISDPVKFTSVIVDRTNPNIIDAYINPFTLDKNDKQVELKFKCNEADDVVYNKSSKININISLFDNLGNEIDTFEGYSTGIFENEEFYKIFNLPDSLTPGKYYIRIEAEDKNSNIAIEQCAFIKESMPPEIIFPEENEIISGIVSIYGNIYDPKWDNNYSLERYELYYKYGEHAVPLDLDNLMDWETAGLTVPGYQKKSSWPDNYGMFTVEGNNLLASFDTAGLNDDLVTLLVVAREEKGYAIGAVKTYRIMDTGINLDVDVDIEDEYKSTTQLIDFNLNNKLTIGYNITHSVDNPVDIYSYVKDDSDKIIKQTAYYNQNSNDMEGRPGIFDSTGAYFYKTGDKNFIHLQNNESDSLNFILNLKSSMPMFNFIDQDGNPFTPVNLIEGGIQYSAVVTIEPGSFYEFGFSLPEDAELNLFVMADINNSDIFIGKNKSLVDTGSIKVFPGSDYPPVIWDGKDNLGRFVKNGLYKIGIEAYGRNGGKGKDTCTVDIKTVFIAEDLTVTNNIIQPLVDTLDYCNIKLYLNKPGYLNIMIYNESNELIKEVNTSPIDKSGYTGYDWFADDNENNIVPAGIYAVVINAHSLEDNSVFVMDKFYYPELGSIIVQDAKIKNNGIITEFYPFDTTEEYNGEQLLKGDYRYRVNITPKGQYLPDRDVKFTVKPEGTKAVEAYPDLNYMGAFRTIYKELWASFKINQIKLRAEYRKGDHNNYYVDIDIEDSRILFSYDPENNELNNDHDLKFEITYTTKTFKIDKWKPGIANGFQKFDKGTIDPGYFEITSGAGYTNVVMDSVKINGYNIVDKGHKVRYVKVTFTVKGTYVPDENFNLARYLANCDGIAVIGPDIEQETDYSHKTDYVHIGIPEEERTTKLIDADPKKSTGMSPDDKTKEIWRENPEYYFYYIGEDYHNNTDYNNGTISYGTELMNYSVDESDDVILVGQLTGRNKIKIPFPDENNDFAYNTTVENGKIRFHLTRTVEWDIEAVDDIEVPYVKDDSFYVVVESMAEDRINYPFPAEVDRESFFEGHRIGSIEDGIPDTYINGKRDSSELIPNFYVPVDCIQDSPKQNIYFDNDVSSFDIDTVMKFNKDKGYNASLNLAGLNSIIDSNFEYINVKRWKINDIQSENIIFNPLTDFIENNLGDYEISDNFIDEITDADWSLNQDNIVNNDAMHSQRNDLNLDELNRYGRLKEVRISDLYDFSAEENTAFRNIYHTGNDGMNIDNDKIVIDPEIRDYTNNGKISGYDINLTCLDKNEFEGIEVENTAIFGKGLKLNDAYILKTNDKSFKGLAAVYGSAEGDIKLSYKNDKTTVWTDIPIYNSDPENNIITYWNVAGLNGKYTLRLVSYVGEEYNIVFKEVYIGHLVNTSVNDAVMTSASGQAEIIFPIGSIPEDTVVNIDSLNFEDIKDVSQIPDVMPVGKVVTLSPDGYVFEDVYPQLQFTYNKNQIDELDIDPRELVIYHLKESGELVPLNTIKQLIKVNYDENGAFAGEEIVWDSKALGNTNEMPDYTYVKAWAIITHFSYYLVLEGLIKDLPKINGSKRYTTGNTSININGSALSNEELAVYVSNDKYCMKQAETPEPKAIAITDDNGNFSFENIELPYEGENYIFIGYTNIEINQYAKMIVTRDTTGPEFTIDAFYKYISPNNDNIYDKINIKINIDENGVLEALIIDKITGNVVKTEQIELYANSDNNYWLINGLNNSNNAIPDGYYDIKLTVSDFYDNKTVYTGEIIIDTNSPLLDIDIDDNIISPANNDGLFDNAAFDVKIDEISELSIWIGNKNNLKQIELFKSNGYMDTLLVNNEWNGKNSLNQDVNDGIYYISVSAVDRAGNINETIFDNTITVDNTPPNIKFNIHDNRFFVIPAELKIPFNLNEDADMFVSIKDIENNEVYSHSQKISKGDNEIIWDASDGITEGLYVIDIEVKDYVGNIGCFSKIIELVYDNIPPEIIITPEYIFEANGILSTILLPEPVVYDDSLPVTITSDAPAEFPLGETIVTWTATDKYGNASSASQKVIIVDTEPPEFTIIPENIIIEAAGEYTSVDIGIAEAYDIFDFTITNNSPVTFPLGETIVTWKAEDINGNISEIEQIIIVKDTTPPETIINIEGKTGANDFYISPVKFNFDSADSASGLKMIEYTLNDGDWIEYNGEDIKIRREGIYTIKYRAVDNQNNTEDTKTVIIKIDLRRPYVIIKTSCKSNPVLYLIGKDCVSGIDKIEYKINNSELMIYDGQIEFFKNGKYTVIFRAIDNAGHKSYWRYLSVHIYGWKHYKKISVKELRWFNCFFKKNNVFNFFHGFIKKHK